MERHCYFSGGCNNISSGFSDPNFAFQIGVICNANKLVCYNMFLDCLVVILPLQQNQSAMLVCRQPNKVHAAFYFESNANACNQTPAASVLAATSQVTKHALLACTEPGQRWPGWLVRARLG